MSTPMSTTLNSSKFAWLLKREFWEYRGAFMWAPIIAAIVMLAITLFALALAEFTAMKHGLQLGGMNLDNVIERIGAGDVAKVHSAIDVGLMGMSLPIAIVSFFVVFSYLIGALYNDRADRSVLFWKSLPLSDTEMVLAKVATAAFTAPVFALGATIALHLGFLILLSLYVILHGFGSALLLLWSPTHLLALWAKLAIALPINALWALPTIGWLLLCSSYARSKPLLWALALPFATLMIGSMVGIFRAMSLSSGWFMTQVVGRLLGSVFPFGWLPKITITDTADSIGDDLTVMHHTLSFDTLVSALTMPSMWIGAAAGAAMIAAAIYFRRSRIESYA